MQRLKLNYLVISAILLVGCASSQAKKDATPPTQAPDPTPAQATTSNSHSHSQSQSEGMHDKMKDMCPMQVEGTAVTAEDVEGGVAVIFTTSSDVAELRKRIAHMAQMHGKKGMRKEGMNKEGMHKEGMHKEGMHKKGMHEKASAGAGSEHVHGNDHGNANKQEGGMMAGKMMMPASTARSEEVEGGAQILLTPQDTADLGKLRKHARQMTERMSSGKCPMMSMQGDA